MKYNIENLFIPDRVRITKQESTTELIAQVLARRSSSYTAEQFMTAEIRVDGVAGWITFLTDDLNMAYDAVMICINSGADITPIGQQGFRSMSVDNFFNSVF